MLKLRDLHTVYDGAISVLRGLSLEVPEGRIVALLGPNGAGKSTALKAISGLLRGQGGAVTGGGIDFLGERIDGLPADEIVRRGIFQVMEGRRVFEDLTVEENLTMGGYTRSDAAGLLRDEKLCYDRFPALKDKRKRLAGYLSGGEQQMLAICRALMARPKLILLDEPSLGLAPLLVREIFRIIRGINEVEKVTILLVEQNANLALSIAHHGCILEGGRVVLEGPPAQLTKSEEVKALYLGGGHGARQSYRDLKHYKKRRRWLS